MLNSPPISLLPKNILKAPSHNPTDQEASLAYAALPNPSAAHPLRRPDQRFLDSEVFTNKFAAHLSGPMEKVTRRTMKRWSEFAQDYSELGATLNGFSLNETGQLSTAIEKTGQAVDATYMSTTKLVRDSASHASAQLMLTSRFYSYRSSNRTGPNRSMSTLSSHPSSRSCCSTGTRSMCSTR